ncbi:MAG TPA: hypothetical protein DCM08_05330, partial [Microscillaceae bacterium]|nr:hypothetical protein [Microscillaceae bacterium]
MNNYAKLDESDPPVVKITFSKEEPSEEVFDDYLKKLHKIISQDHRIILLFDASNATFLNSKLRIKQGKFLKEYQSAIAKSVVSYVFIIPSKII